MTHSTFGAESGRLADLLAVTSQSDGSGKQLPGEPTLGQTVEVRLSSPLALEPETVDSVPAVLSRLCPELQPLVGRPLAEVLTDSSTSQKALVTIKEYSKALARTWQEGHEHTVAMLIYYAAIAAALSHHGCKITTRAPDELHRTLGVLGGTPGLTESVAHLFSGAASLCRAEEE